MKMESYKPRRKKKYGWAVLLVVLLVAAGGLWWYRSRESGVSESPAVAASLPADETQAAAPAPSPAAMPRPAPLPPAEAARPAPGPKGMTRGLAEHIGPSPITVSPVSQRQALDDWTKGRDLYSRNRSIADLLEARTLLNRAYLSGQLSDTHAMQARSALEDLANRTVLRRDTYVNPADPYLQSHTFAPGERLLSLRQRGTGKVLQPGVIARYNLCVPYRVISWVNGLNSATEFRAGKSYKLLKGPFHMVVYKGQFAADLFLQDLFVRRVPVGIGLPETPTPDGYFRIVSWTGKTAHSTYYPPVDSGQPNVGILPGQPGYPLGPDGLNMKIEGIGELGTSILASQGYAIHGTSDPSSIGRPCSRGCIRLRNSDIRFVYGAFQDYAAPDDTKATWSRWSTITVRP